MKQTKLKILSKENLTADIVRMWLGSKDAECHGIIDSICPGQFVNLSVPGYFLRRPISVCDTDNGDLCLVFKIIGNGTKTLSEMAVETVVDILLPLGNGFDLTKAGSRPLLVGGGVGVPPLLKLARHLASEGIRSEVVLGFNSAREIILADEFRALGCNVHISTVDGSEGVRGFVTDAISHAGLDKACSYFYACGPRPMLSALCRQLTIPGEVSMEERMGCGFGACMGCTCHTSEGPKQVCTDGPVFPKDIIMFE